MPARAKSSPSDSSAHLGYDRIYDPACGSGGMFMQSKKFAKSTAASSATSASTANQLAA